MEIPILVGDEGGFVPPLKSVNERLKFISEAIEELGYIKEFGLAIGATASEFYEKGHYNIMEKELSSGELTDFYSEMCENFKIISIEDSMNEGDWAGWTRMKTKMGEKNLRRRGK